MRTRLLWWMALVVLPVMAGCNDSPSAHEDEPVIDRVEVNPFEAVLLVGDSVSVRARALTADNEPVAGTIVWSNSNPAVATVHGSGDSVVVRTKAPGEVRIEAKVGSVVGYVDITVDAPPAVVALALTPGTVVLEVGQQAWLQALPRTADSTVVAGEDVAWSIAPAGAATLAVQEDESWATVNAAAAGEAVITATVNGIVAQANVRVVPAGGQRPQVASVDIVPGGFSLPIDHETNVQAVARTSGGLVLTDREVTWTITPEGLADLTPWGNAFARITGRAAGTVRITAAVDGLADTVLVQITTLTPAPQTVTELRFDRYHSGMWTEQTQSYRERVTAYGPNGVVTDPALTWSVGNPGIATVDAAGVVTAVSPGTTSLHVSCGSVSTVAVVTVFPRENEGLYELTWDWWDMDWHMPPVVGQETWTDPNGAAHQVAVYLVGGTLRIADDGAYERTLEYGGWVTINGTGARVIERHVVDRGTASIMVGGETGYRLTSTTTPGYQYVVTGYRDVGHLVMRASVDGLPEASYLFRLQR